MLQLQRMSRVVSKLRFLVRISPNATEIKDQAEYKHVYLTPYTQKVSEDCFREIFSRFPRTGRWIHGTHNMLSTTQMHFKRSYCFLSLSLRTSDVQQKN